MRLAVQQGCKKEESNILEVSSVVWHLDKGVYRFLFALVHFHLCSLTCVLSTSWGFHISTCAPQTPRTWISYSSFSVSIIILYFPHLSFLLLVLLVFLPVTSARSLLLHPQLRFLHQRSEAIQIGLDQLVVLHVLSRDQQLDLQRNIWRVNRSVRLKVGRKFVAFLLLWVSQVRFVLVTKCFIHILITAESTDTHTQVNDDEVNLNQDNWCRLS